MNQAQAQRTVLAIVLVVAAVVAWDNIKRTGKATPSGKSLVSLVVLGVGLSVGAGVAPAIVGPFALLVGLAVVVSRSGSLAARRGPVVGKPGTSTVYNPGGRSGT